MIYNDEELADTLRAQAERLAVLERMTAAWCDQPDDRMWHAADGTWWRRDGDRLVSADMPPRLRCAGSVAGRCALQHRAHWNCPECGPHVAVDEDGCCSTCGADCVGIESGAEHSDEESG